MNVAYTADLPDRVSHEKGVSRYVRELLAHLPDHVNVTTTGRLGTPADADLVHVTAPRVAYAPHLLAGTPTVLTVHGLDAYWPPQFRAKAEPNAWLQQKILPHLVRRADAWIVPSRFLQSELVERAGYPAERVHVVNHGVSDVFRRSEPVSDSDYLLTTTPRPVLVKALARLRNNGHSLRLVVAGERGYGPDAAVAVAERHGVAHKVEFVGHVDDRTLADLYAGALAYVHWTDYDTFALPVAEAMASGTPVVANDVAVMPAVVGDGGRVLGDVAGLISELSRLVRVDGYRMQRARAGLDRAERFTWARTAERTADVYERVVNQG